MPHKVNIRDVLTCNVPIVYVKSRAFLMSDDTVVYQNVLSSLPISLILVVATFLWKYSDLHLFSCSSMAVVLWNYLLLFDVKYVPGSDITTMYRQGSDIEYVWQLGTNQIASSRLIMSIIQPFTMDILWEIYSVISMGFEETPMRMHLA